MISVTEAIQIVKEQTRPLSSEQVPLAEALGRFLAEDVIADSDLPPFNRAQMDGYAVRAQKPGQDQIRDSNNYSIGVDVVVSLIV